MAAVWREINAPFAVALSRIAFEHLQRLDALPASPTKLFESESCASRLVEEVKPEAVLLSATGKPQEQSLASICKVCDATVTQIVDTWDGYENRFGDVFPDYVAVIDDRAEAECRSSGGPDAKYVHVGQPAWEAYSKLAPPESGRGERFLFVGQPLQAVFGQALGYDEVSVAAEVRESLSSQAELRARLTYLLHPAEQRAPTGYIETRNAKVALSEAETVIGMFSSFLINGLLNGRRVVVIQPERGRDRFGPSRHGLLRKYDSASGVDWLARSDCDEAASKITNLLRGSRQRVIQHMEGTKCA